MAIEIRKIEKWSNGYSDVEITHAQAQGRPQQGWYAWHRWCGIPMQHNDFRYKKQALDWKQLVLTHPAFGVNNDG
jgi:hypothetical protein